MCGRFYLTINARSAQSLHDLGAQVPVDYRFESYNIAPSQTIPVVLDRGGQRALQAAVWGMLPQWAKDKGMKPMINARAETAAVKPYFRNAFKDGRCVIPASGFYEWQRIAGRKIPHAVALPDNNLMFFAGLYEMDDEYRLDCAILTTGANGQMAKLHDRMPVILPPDAVEQWMLFGDKGVLTTYDGHLSIWPVSARVNSTGNNGMVRGWFRP